ncbi:unnamed protein product, partial [Coregonus sp. 'balchen']
FLEFEIPITSLSEAKLYGTEVDGDLTLNNDAKGMCWFSSLGYLWHHFQYNHTFDMPVLSSLCISESSLMSPVSTSSVMGGSDHESDDTIILSDDGSPSRKRQRSDDEAKNLIESILNKKPGGEVVIRKYSKTKSLTFWTR